MLFRSQGQWKVCKPDASIPTVGETTTTTEAGSITVKTGEADLADWIENVEKALGNIRLRLHHTISYQFNDIESPSVLWGKLKETYGTPGLNRAFIEFKCAMDTAIPHGSDPGPALDKILTHFTRLRNEF